MTPLGSSGGCYQIPCSCVLLFGAVSCFNMSGLQQETSDFFLVHKSLTVGILDYFGNGKNTGGDKRFLVQYVENNFEALSYVSRYLGCDGHKILMKQ